MRNTGQALDAGAFIDSRDLFHPFIGAVVGDTGSHAVAHDATFCEHALEMVFPLLFRRTSAHPLDDVQADFRWCKGLHRAIELAFDLATAAVAIVTVDDVILGEAQFAIGHAVREHDLQAGHAQTNADHKEVANKQGFEGSR